MRPNDTDHYCYSFLFFVTFGVSGGMRLPSNPNKHHFRSSIPMMAELCRNVILACVFLAYYLNYNEEWQEA